VYRPDYEMAGLIDTSKPPDTSEDADKFRYSEEELHTKRNKIKFLSGYDEVNKLRFYELRPFDSESPGTYTYDWDCDGNILSVGVTCAQHPSMDTDANMWATFAVINNAKNTIGRVVCSYSHKTNEDSTRIPSLDEEYILEINDVDIKQSGVCVWWVTCALLSICSLVNPSPGGVEGFVNVASQSPNAGPCYVRAFQILNFKIKHSLEKEKDGLVSSNKLSATHSYQMVFSLDEPTWEPVTHSTEKTLSLKF